MSKKLNIDTIYIKLNNALKELDIYFDFLKSKLSVDNDLESFLRLLVNQSYNFNIDSYSLDDYDIQYYYLNIMELFKNDKKVKYYLKQLLKTENIDKYIIIYYNSNYNYVSFYGSYKLKKDFNKELKRIDKEFKQIELENSCYESEMYNLGMELLKR